MTDPTARPLDLVPDSARNILPSESATRTADIIRDGAARFRALREAGGFDDADLYELATWLGHEREKFIGLASTTGREAHPEPEAACCPGGDRCGHRP